MATMLRDQGGGPDSFLLEFTPEFTKDFLGAKDMYVNISPVPTLVYLRESTVNWVRSNTFLIPEIVYDPSLIFSPHVVLGGIIFADEAFAAPNLMTPEKLSTLDIEPGCNQLPLPFKPEKADVPIFCAIIRTLEGWGVSPTKTVDVRGRQVIHDKTRSDHWFQTSYTPIRAPIRCGQSLQREWLVSSLFST